MAYTNAIEAKTKAFDAALGIATKNPANTTVDMITAQYDQWIAENAKG